MSFNNIEVNTINWQPYPPPSGSSAQGPLNTVQTSNGSGIFVNSGILAGPAPLSLLPPPNFGNYVDMNPSNANSDLMLFANQTPSLMPNIMAFGANASNTGSDDLAVLNGATGPVDLLIANKGSGGICAMIGDTVAMINQTSNNTILCDDANLTLLLQGAGTQINILDNVNNNEISTSSSGVLIQSASNTINLVCQGLALNTNSGPCTITITINSGGASYPLVFPSSQGGVGTTLRNDGAGNLTWGI